MVALYNHIKSNPDIVKIIIVTKRQFGFLDLMIKKEINSYVAT